VGATKSEAGAGVVERGAQPSGRAVALGAGLRKADLDVVGILGAVEIFQMATDAVGGRALVLSAHVAGRALQRGMGAGERKAGAVVIETGRNPRCRVVAYLALLRESGRSVVRVIGVLEILQVAGHAQGAEIRKLTARVAGLALQRGVPTRERETTQRVVECGIGPGNRAVADGAIRGESAGDVVRVVCFLEVCHVAGRTRGRHRRIAAIDVAL